MSSSTSYLQLSSPQPCPHLISRQLPTDIIFPALSPSHLPPTTYRSHLPNPDPISSTTTYLQISSSQPCSRLISNQWGHHTLTVIISSTLFPSRPPAPLFPNYNYYFPNHVPISSFTTHRQLSPLKQLPQRAKPIML